MQCPFMPCGPHAHMLQAHAMSQLQGQVLRTTAVASTAIAHLRLIYYTSNPLLVKHTTDTLRSCRQSMLHL
jgi:hypothetical protein